VLLWSQNVSSEKKLLSRFLLAAWFTQFGYPIREVIGRKTLKLSSDCPFHFLQNGEGVFTNGG
jgi:hypothetical protein